MAFADVPVHRPEPDEPGSVVPWFQVTPVKFAQGPGSPAAQSEFVVPKEIRLCEACGWCMPVTEVDATTGFASHPEKNKPPGNEPVKRSKVKSLAVPVTSKSAP